MPPSIGRLQHTGRILALARGRPEMVDGIGYVGIVVTLEASLVLLPDNSMADWRVPCPVCSLKRRITRPEH